jgi:hypothetical protein
MYKAGPCSKFPVLSVKIQNKRPYFMSKINHVKLFPSFYFFWGKLKDVSVLKIKSVGIKK